MARHQNYSSSASLRAGTSGSSVWFSFGPGGATVSALAASALFLLTAWFASSDVTPLVDLAAMDAVAGWRSGSLTGVMRTLSSQQDKVVTVIILSLLAAYGVRRQWQHFLLLFISVPGGMLMNVGLKSLVHRDRPSLTALVGTHGYSFPSGHTIAATLAVGYLLIEFYRIARSPALRACATVLGMSLITAVGFSRIYLSAHYLTDVLAAVFAGAAWLAACFGCAQRADRSRRRGSDLQSQEVDQAQVLTANLIR